MKKIFYIVGLTLLLISCKKETWLKEEAYGFYTPENSYTTPGQIDIASVELYRNVSDLLYGKGGDGTSFIFSYTTDVGYDAIAPNHELNSWSDNITPETGRVSTFWNSFYQWIYDANVILTRIETIKYATEEEKNAKKAEAMFFRAFAYRHLAIMFGGVPIVLKEINTPRRDFVRASTTEVWAQVISDLTYATEHLPGANEVKQDGRITKGAAYHMLAEAYIVTKDYPKAITATSQVINNLGYSLMKTRFGTKKSDPGDVYWDLFRRGNQNRKSGNMEAIYVSQYEYKIPGGQIDDSLPRFLVPLYWQLQGVDGKSLFVGPSFQYGRGIGWWAASDYTINQIWANTTGDIRNSEYNIVRDIKADNPKSAFYGKDIVASGAFKSSANLLNRYWSAIFTKAVPVNDFPDDVLINAANNTFRDRYVIRLAETYLLRAEAYLLSGNTALAAQDINQLRKRASSPLVNAVDVTVDFILDERARELFAEEQRLLTILRTNTNIERIRKYNPMYNGTYATNKINSYQNLWPIPSSEIERNTEAKLVQNPGY